MIFLLLVGCFKADLPPEEPFAEVPHRWGSVPAEHFPMKAEWLTGTDCVSCHTEPLDYEKWTCGPPWQPIPDQFKRWEVALRRDPCVLE